MNPLCASLTELLRLPDDPKEALLQVGKFLEAMDKSASPKYRSIYDAKSIPLGMWYEEEFVFSLRYYYVECERVAKGDL